MTTIDPDLIDRVALRRAIKRLERYEALSPLVHAVTKRGSVVERAVVIRLINSAPARPADDSLDAALRENTVLREALGIIAAPPVAAPDAIGVTARNIARAALAAKLGEGEG